MGMNLSVANDRESSPDPWWLDSHTTSANVNASAILKEADTSSEEQSISDEVAIAVAAAVANSTELPTVGKLIVDENVEEEQNQSQEDGNIFQTGIRHEENQKKLEIFKQELATKREARQKAIAALTDKLKELQQQVKTEENARINAEVEVTRLKELLAEGGLKEELEKERSKVKTLEIELENERKLRLDLEKDKEDVKEKEQQIHALREVASIGKEMLRIRELQVNELKKKLCETQYPEDLREEYEAQIQNVRRLKTLYEERAEAVRIEHQREIETEAARIQVLEKKISELVRERKEGEVMREHLKSRVLKLDQELEERNDSAMTLQEQLDASVIECRDLASQMGLINNLFLQILVGNLNLERITRLVEENQSLVVDLTSDDKKNDLAALLIDIAKQLDEDNSMSGYSKEIKNNNEEQQQNVVDSSITNNNNTMSKQDVALNLSKVRRILVQLLSQDQGSSSSQISECDSESCYKSVETPSGKRSVISVSQTFLTLKNLILEKNSLIKEVNKLRLLNEHLETRLGSQEKRLSTVSTELKKTWGVVSKLRVQHKQLHTQEKILKYELQHKRLLLNDLKDELERCKEIWDMARQKNCQSEEEWRKLRKEFADRRKNADINNSAESGYEDDESNTPPTEDSIDEQELDRLIDPENDSFLMMNEEPGNSGVFINDISNTRDYQDDQQNDSDTTIELLDTNLSVPSVGSTSSEEVTVDDKQNNFEPEEHNSIENLPTREDGITGNPIVPESEVLNSNGETIKDTRPSETAKSLVPTDTTAENISRFLEGLLAPDDTYQFTTNSSSKDEKSGSLEMESSSIDYTSSDDSCRNENFSKTKNLDTQPNNSDSDNFPSIGICVTSSELNDDSKIEKSLLPSSIQKDETLPDPNSENNTERSECKVHELKSETVVVSVSVPDDYCQTYEETGKFDEACGYSPTNFSEKSTSPDIPSVQEVLGRLCTNTDDNSKSLVVADQSLKKTCVSRTTEEVLDARTERLKRLEEQCKSLFNKVTATTIKSNVLSSRLELLHEQYGRSSENFDDMTPSTTSTNNRHNNNENLSDDKTDVKSVPAQGYYKSARVYVQIKDRLIINQ